jgi:hypothetical protein
MISSLCLIVKSQYLHTFVKYSLYTSCEINKKLHEIFSKHVSCSNFRQDFQPFKGNGILKLTLRNGRTVSWTAQNELADRTRTSNREVCSPAVYYKDLLSLNAS